MRYFLLSLLLCSLTFADKTPSLSPSGKKRLMENLKILDKNLTDVQTNLINCKKNIETAESSIKELSALEQESLVLRSKYKSQVEDTEVQLEKNEKAIAELEKFQKNITMSGSEAQQEKQKQDLEKAQKDMLEREAWKTQAKAKAVKINDWIKTLNQNIKSIDAKKIPLREEMNLWLRKEKEYQKLQADMTNKKSETEALLKVP